MDFLIVLLAIIWLEAAGELTFIQRDGWLGEWYQGLSKLGFLNDLHYLKAGLFALLPVLLLALIIRELQVNHLGLVVFILELLVLLYALGRGNLQSQIGVLKSDLRRDDMQAAFHDAAVLNISHREGKAETWDDFHQEVLAALPYRFFERSFAVIFWFFLFGAPAALFYRLLALHGDLRLNEGEQPSSAKLLWLLEWIPARLLALTTALVGNFSYAVSHLQDLLFCPRTATAGLLRRCVIGAMGIAEPSDSDSSQEHSNPASSQELSNQEQDNPAPVGPVQVGLEELPNIQALFGRSMTAWLVFIAIFVVLS